jgi:hypothetical protein
MGRPETRIFLGIAEFVEKGISLAPRLNSIAGDGLLHLETRKIARDGMCGVTSDRKYRVCSQRSISYYVYYARPCDYSRNRNL